VDKVKEIFIFECEEDWIEALEATFKPWKDKVHIVNKFVTDYSDGKNISLDDYFCGKNIFPTIIKADVEGSEVACVRGASKLLTQHIRHIFLCTYHRFNDFEVLSEAIKKLNFKVTPSEGYMLYYFEEPDYNNKDIAKIFRKALIYAHREDATELTL
jgi:hypothetical protein